MAENRQNRRYPQNLQGVLQLAVEAGSAAEGSAPVQSMSEDVSVYLRVLPWRLNIRSDRNVDKK